MPKVGIVISMYNKNDLTHKCIDSIFANAGIKCDIVVVDDGSAIPYKDDRVSIIRFEEPHGNTHSMNAGILFFDNKYDYIVNLDNDIVLKPNAIKYLTDVMEANPNIALASSVRYTDIKGKTWLLGQGIDLHGRAAVVEEDYEDTYSCHWICGCSVMLRTSVIRQIGIFDKRFKNYCQDAEWCLRATANDYHVAMVCKSRVIHEGSGTITDINTRLGDDRKTLLKIISCHGMNTILKELPIDKSNNVYGRIRFSVYPKLKDA